MQNTIDCELSTMNTLKTRTVDSHAVTPDGDTTEGKYSTDRQTKPQEDTPGNRKTKHSSSKKPPFVTLIPWTTNKSGESARSGSYHQPPPVKPSQLDQLEADEDGDRMKKMISVSTVSDVFGVGGNDDVHDDVVPLSMIQEQGTMQCIKSRANQ